MARKAKPASARVEIVWPKTGAVARPWPEDIDAWLAKGWQRVTTEIAPAPVADDTPDQDASGD